ncbi:MAG: hypothetical protein RLZZ399_2011 [Verrucomicrobiota bacterium]|jgi:hypothetical protein
MDLPDGIGSHRPRLAIARHCLPTPRYSLQNRSNQAGAHPLRDLFTPDKLNVATIGNLVPQLHVHAIARFKTDDAWPKPVFGFAPPIPYTPEQRANLLERIRAGLQNLWNPPNAAIEHPGHSLLDRFFSAGIMDSNSRCRPTGQGRSSELKRLAID